MAAQIEVPFGALGASCGDVFDPLNYLGHEPFPDRLTARKKLFEETELIDYSPYSPCMSIAEDPALVGAHNATPRISSWEVLKGLFGALGILSIPDEHCVPFSVSSSQMGGMNIMVGSSTVHLPTGHLTIYHHSGWHLFK